jgi:hypothetical protein
MPLIHGEFADATFTSPAQESPRFDGGKGDQSEAVEELLTFFLTAQSAHARHLEQIRAEMAALGADWLRASA